MSELCQPKTLNYVYKPALKRGLTMKARHPYLRKGTYAKLINITAANAFNSYAVPSNKCPTG